MKNSVNEQDIVFRLKKLEIAVEKTKEELEEKFAQRMKQIVRKLNTNIDKCEELSFKANSLENRLYSLETNSKITVETVENLKNDSNSLVERVEGSVVDLTAQMKNTLYPQIPNKHGLKSLSDILNYLVVESSSFAKISKRQESDLDIIRRENRSSQAIIKKIAYNTDNNAKMLVKHSIEKLRAEVTEQFDCSSFKMHSIENKLAETEKHISSQSNTVKKELNSLESKIQINSISAKREISQISDKVQLIEEATKQEKDKITDMLEKKAALRAPKIRIGTIKRQVRKMLTLNRRKGKRTKTIVQNSPSPSRLLLSNTKTVTHLSSSRVLEESSERRLSPVHKKSVSTLTTRNPILIQSRPFKKTKRLKIKHITGETLKKLSSTSLEYSSTQRFKPKNMLALEGLSFNV